MIKLASITPIKDFHLSLEGDGPIMLLTHLVHRFPEYAAQARAYKGYKILDNSLIELGTALNLSTVLEAAAIVEADEIILPDVFRNKEETIKTVEKALEEMRDYHAERAVHYKLMAVAQGSTVEEFAECFRIFSNNPEIDVIGVPKAIKNRAGLKDLYMSSNKEIHFLGCPESLMELEEMGPVLRERIRSIDTCIPALISTFTDYPLAKRPTDRTIDLVNDRVNEANYRKIIESVDLYLEEQASPSKRMIYLAGPLFTETERKQRYEEAELLRSRGFIVFNPIELNDSGVNNPREIFNGDLCAMTLADACVLTIDNYDSGTMVELGYFLGTGKPVVAIWTDFRSEEPANLFVRGAATYAANHTLRSFDIDRITDLLLNPYQE